MREKRDMVLCNNHQATNTEGMPWEVYYYNDHLLITKSGDIQGFGSLMTMIPDLHLGVAVFGNAAGCIVPHCRFLIT